MPLHPLLKRQLKRLGLDVESGAPDAERWRELVQRVSRAYEEHDQERYLLERSQDLASQEMAALYATVRADRDLLDSRVRERTEALALSEGRLSSLLSLSADWIWEQDAELRFSYFSDGIEAATGIAPTWLIGKQRMSQRRLRRAGRGHRRLRSLRRRPQGLSRLHLRLHAPRRRAALHPHQRRTGVRRQRQLQGLPRRRPRRHAGHGGGAEGA